ncbi:MAG: polysaccharide biosynthesis protein [Limosilactobacillus sp.]|jgi:O-antigen/teichoic acid export membrane protein|uniref:putative polysaccharide biosynthesis protein n=1 Tax=Limosilactobacillus sp. TaxID=2773925 RepID=UPI0025BE9EAD|nr:polysaccharide biosynthesis protein [Limosilactobacillus sp.]MCI1974880.1 polysaccharide biosynthesis protein [Limosilactobacillus sp.]MCI2031079.1 polysaccharide biosynthesis protein [Limosilactobacillus sp.]
MSEGQPKDTARSKMLNGSAWMTAGNITSRILGAIYIIPWVTWLGAYSDEANALYAQGYNIYSLFITISTAGIPSAISKLVAHYNGLNEYGVSQKLNRSAMYMALASGVICGTVMMYIASWPIVYNGDTNLIPVLRSLAWAIFIIPLMAISRGIFQGYSMMAPSAISQFVEQLFRIVYMLVATYLIMKIQKGSWVSAVSQSTFAAFIGAIGACVVLFLAWLKYRGFMRGDGMIEQPAEEVSTTELILKIVYQSIPFIIIESGINIFQLVDQYSFKRMMPLVGHFSKYQIDVLYALFAFNANKLYMIIIALANALAVTAIPLLAMARARNDQAGMRNQIENVLMLFYFVMIPAVLGLYAVAQQIYTVFYRYNHAGVIVLEFAAFMAIPLGLYTVAAAMMQGISENRRMMKYLGIGLVIKLLIQFPCIWIAQGLGPLLATGIAMMIINLLIIRSFNQEFRLNFEQMALPTNQILAYSLVMLVVTKGLMLLLGLFINPYGRYTAFFTLIIGVLVGAGVYGYLALHFRLADLLLGGRAERLRQILHIS